MSLSPPLFPFIVSEQTEDLFFYTAHVLTVKFSLFCVVKRRNIFLSHLTDGWHNQSSSLWSSHALCGGSMQCCHIYFPVTFNVFFFFNEIVIVTWNVHFNSPFYNKMLSKSGHMRTFYYPKCFKYNTHFCTWRKFIKRLLNSLRFCSTASGTEYYRSGVFK